MAVTFSGIAGSTVTISGAVTSAYTEVGTGQTAYCVCNNITSATTTTILTATAGKTALIQFISITSQGAGNNSEIFNDGVSVLKSYNKASVDNVYIQPNGTMKVLATKALTITTANTEHVCVTVGYVEV